MKLKTVNVPDSFSAIFNSAEGFVKNYFDKMVMSPEEGTINIAGERYILMRASSLSVNFLEYIRQLHPSTEDQEATEASSTLLYDIANSIGKSDARCFHEKKKLVDPIEKLSTGPIHFSHCGRGFVHIF